ncbi:hypothetical protein [Leifsonia virtsii]|uniref:Colicin transporter n=1 Tax=Leifsonia virtsii TaxID=3035915 RepID=A0ABT8J034_9MICO|nr:hypothetical protein [Leifsonia virtsii]MDN4598445.1 hypothetical protein [Leifsonia virtsii]
MSDSVGDKPVSTLYRIIVGGILVVAVAALAIGIGTAAHAAQVRADAQKAMVAAAPAYDGAITLGGNLDQLAAQSVQAKAAYDAEQERLAAEKAAQEAAAAQAAAAAAKAAADEAARQAQQQAAADDETSEAPAQPSSGKLPAGSPVPWIANPDPQDTAGGRWDTSACASGSASGNPAICD